MNCRIIDIHTHIYPVALARRAMEVTGHENDDFKKLPIRENLLARMREAGVNLSVNLPVVFRPWRATWIYVEDGWRFVDASRAPETKPQTQSRRR